MARSHRAVADSLGERLVELEGCIVVAPVASSMVTKANATRALVRHPLIALVREPADPRLVDVAALLSVVEIGAAPLRGPVVALAI